MSSISSSSLPHSTSDPYVFEGDPTTINVVGDLMVLFLVMVFGIALHFLSITLQHRAIRSGKGISVSNLVAQNVPDACKHIVSGGGSIVAWCIIALFAYTLILQPVVDLQLRFETAHVKAGEGPVGRIGGTDDGDFPGFLVQRYEPTIRVITDGFTPEEFEFSSERASRWLDISLGESSPPLKMAEETKWSILERQSQFQNGGRDSVVAYHFEGLPIVSVAEEFRMIDCDPLKSIEREEVLRYEDGRREDVTRPILTNECTNARVGEEYLGNTNRVGVSALFRKTIVESCFDIDEAEQMISPSDRCQLWVRDTVDELENTQFADLLEEVGRAEFEVLKINNWSYSPQNVRSIVVDQGGPFVFPGSPLLTLTSLFFSLDNEECKSFVHDGLYLSDQFPDNLYIDYVKNASDATMSFDDAWCAVNMATYCGYSGATDTANDGKNFCRGVSDVHVAVVRGLARNDATEKQFWHSLTVSFRSSPLYQQSDGRGAIIILRGIGASLLTSNLGFSVKPYYEEKAVGRIGAGYIATVVLAVCFSIVLALIALALRCSPSYRTFPVPESPWEGYQLGLSDAPFLQTIIAEHRGAADPFTKPHKQLLLGVIPPPSNSSEDSDADDDPNDHFGLGSMVIPDRNRLVSQRQEPMKFPADGANSESTPGVVADAKLVLTASSFPTRTTNGPAPMISGVANDMVSIAPACSTRVVVPAPPPGDINDMVSRTSNRKLVECRE